MYLVDTNVWLEALLDQERAEEARNFLQRTDSVNLFLTDFSLFSIGIILTRLKKDALFQTFLRDTVEESGVMLVRLDTDGLDRILSLRRSVALDFDDAYQYVAAEANRLTIVSFDADFDRTEQGRKQPHQVTA
jgi:predicted nucleic acid-binding protein